MKNPSGNYITNEEHFKIARKLEQHHAIFERVWSMSRIRFSRHNDTAGVKFNKKGDLIDFFVNPDFWKELNFETKCFVVSHECMHISLNHGARSVEFIGDRRKSIISNIAQDIVINHTLTDRYGFDRDLIDPIGPIFHPKTGEPVIDKKTGKQLISRKYCWVDTIFPDDKNIRSDENFEYYYNKLMKKSDEELEKMAGQSSLVDDHEFNQGDSSQGQQGQEQGQQGQGQDGKDDGSDEKGEKGKLEDLPDDPNDYNYFDPEEYSDDFSEVIDKLNEELTEDEKDTLKNFINENERNEEDFKQPEENPDYGPDGTTAPSSGKGGGQGDSAGSGWTFAKKLNKPKKKKKFESIITKWAKMKISEKERVMDQWIHKNRRLANLKNQSIILPSEHEVIDRFKKEDRINVFFYQDTSASCGGYKDRFFAIAEAMPLDKFNMRMFCFDTKIYETSLESRKLYGFGGTHFHILENHVQQLIRTEGIKHPDAVFVVTDGFGTNVIHEKPENWHWLLTPDGSTENIPKECNIHDLTNYE